MGCNGVVLRKVVVWTIKVDPVIERYPTAAAAAGLLRYRVICGFDPHLMDICT